MSDYRTCKNCIYKSKLAHNFVVGKGWETSLCCLLFAHNNYIIEVQEDGTCEEFLYNELEVEENAEKES